MVFAERRNRSQKGAGFLCGVTVATLTLAHGVWGATRSQLPPQSEISGLDPGTTVWVAPGTTPITLRGDLDAAAVLVIGDSRVQAGVDQWALSRSSLGPACVAAAPGSDVQDLLRFAIARAPNRLIVALSPHALVPARNKVVRELMRELPPVLEPDRASPREVRQWRSRELDHLESLGFPRPYCAQIIGRLEESFLRERDRLNWPHRRWEQELESSFAQVRYRTVYTLSAEHWSRSWLNERHPAVNDPTYRKALHSKHFRNRLEPAAAATTRLLAEAARVCPTVVIRLPVSSSLRAIEDEAISAEDVAAIARRASVPYFDFGTSALTGDGSHLTFEGAVEFTGELLSRLE